MKRRRPFLRFVLLCLCLFALRLACKAPSALLVHDIDVGQGDSTFVQFPNGQCMLVDAGDQDHGSTVVEYLHRKGIKRIDILVATHPHVDHIGGMADVIDSFVIGKVWDSGYVHTSKIQQNFYQLIKDKNIQLGKPRAGFHDQVGDVKIDCLAPGKDLLYGTGSPNSDGNNNSIVLCLTYRQTTVLLTGDMQGAERATIANWPEAVILKVAHHGSNTGTDRQFLDAVSPRYAAISYGTSYGYPHRETIDLLRSHNVRVYGTGTDGTIDFSVINDVVSVATVKTSHAEAP